MNDFNRKLSKIFDLDLFQNELQDINLRVDIFIKSIEEFCDIDFLQTNTVLIIPTRFANEYEFFDDILLLGAPCYFYDKGSLNNDGNIKEIALKFSAYYLIIDSYYKKISISNFLNKETNLLNYPVLIQTHFEGFNCSTKITSGSEILLVEFDFEKIQEEFIKLYYNIESVLTNIDIIKLGSFFLKAKSEDKDLIFSQISQFLQKNENIVSVVGKLHKILKESTINIIASWKIRNETDNPIFKLGKTQESIENFIFLLLNLSLYSYNSGLHYNYYIPSIVSKNFLKSGKNDSSYGTIVLSARNELSEDALTNTLLISNTIWANIAIIDQNELNKELIKNATRAAVSQVMARNMSHNIGSHVLSKLITILQLMGILQPENKWQCKTNKEFEFKDKAYIKELHSIIEEFKEKCNNNSKDTDKTIEECFNKIFQALSKFEEKTFSNYTYLERFFAYLKARMDFLADITTNTPVIENTKGVYNDIVKPFINNRVLNDRISGIDDFKYEIMVCQPPANKQEHCVNHTTVECHKTPHVIAATNDIQLSIPNDLLGSHAFYTILENIIRNTAKHGTTPVEKNEQGEIVKDMDGKEIKLPVEFKIKVEEASLYQKINTGPKRIDESKDLDWNEFYAISIFDNCDLSKDSKNEPLKSDISKWTDKEKEEAGLNKDCTEIPRIQWLVITQNRHLNDSILKDNQLRHGAWGLIEMDASAAYLRKIDVELIDSDKYQITCLQGENPVTQDGELAIFQAYAEQEKYLGYRFFIRKPQEILIIGDDEDLEIKNLSNDAKKELLKKYKNEGVWIYDKESFKKCFKDNEQKVFPHKLLVLVKPDGGAIENLIKDNEACFSKRFYQSDKFDLVTDNHSKEGIDKFKLNLWINYYKNNAIKFYGVPCVPFKKIKENNFKLVKDSTEKCLSAIVETHAKDYCQKQFGKKNDCSSTPFDFIEIKVSATDHFFNDISTNKSDEKFIKYYQQWASAPIPILVMDERIQEFTVKNKHSIENLESCSPVGDTCYHKQGGIPYQVVYSHTNINIPNAKECNLNAQSFNSIEKDTIPVFMNIIETFQTFIANHKTEKHFFVVIHLGIIEKLISAYKIVSDKNYDKDKKEKTCEFVKEILLNMNKVYCKGKEDLSKYYDHIVVTSGRGTPQNIPQGIRYLNFSVISQYIITLRNKYAFTEALYSARQTN